MNLFKRKPKEETVSKAYHDEIVKNYAMRTAQDETLIARRGAIILERNGTIRNLQGLVDELTAELAHWRKHGQLRDPKTGRLIPKAQSRDKQQAEVG